MIPRSLTPQILTATPPKAVLIYGPRQAGKTTLLHNLPNLGTVNYFCGDIPRDRARLQGLQSAGDIDVMLAGSDSIIIDEAQRIPNIGLTVKMLADANKKTKIFLTGSSSFELAQGVRESAVGRLDNRTLWPLSLGELAAKYGWGFVQSNLERFLVFGTYPEVVTNPDLAGVTLANLSGDLMFRDVFALEQVRSSDKLSELVTLLALRIGQEISYESLGRDLKLHSQTVERYIDILEKCFLIRRCPSFARNLDNEIKKGKKIYFCDVGLRNAILSKFEPFSGRDDAGALWENFFFMERLKKHELERSFTRQYFWRIRGRKIRNIDFVEVLDQDMQAFECKLNPRQKDNGGSDFRSAYPNCPIRVVSPEMLDPALFL